VYGGKKEPIEMAQAIADGDLVHEKKRNKRLNKEEDAKKRGETSKKTADTVE